MIITGNFEKWEDVLSEFRVDAKSVGVVLPLYAGYEQEDYDGSASVFFIKDNNLYGVYGSHCSCFGLEEQWEPELIEWEVAVEFLTKSFYIPKEYKDLLIPLVNTLATSPDRESDIGQATVFYEMSK